MSGNANSCSTRGGQDLGSELGGSPHPFQEAAQAIDGQRAVFEAKQWGRHFAFGQSPQSLPSASLLLGGIGVRLTVFSVGRWAAGP
jgi:hypothetical protein